MRFQPNNLKIRGEMQSMRSSSRILGALAAIAISSLVFRFAFMNYVSSSVLEYREADDIHALSELAYHTSQNKALQWLQAYPSSWANHDVWLLMGPFHNCPMRQRIGASVDGGKWICDSPAVLRKASRQSRGGGSCNVYSLGSAGSTSFEEAIHEMDSSCAIHTFDHTLNKEEAQKVRDTPGVTFHPKGITSNLLLKTSGAEFTSISKSMAELNIPWLDILKIDIEGAEWSVFLEMLEEGMPMPFTQILIEIHAGMTSPAGEKTEDVLRRFFTGMHAAGFRVFSVEYNVWVTNAPSTCFEYSFIKVDSNGHPVRPR